MYGPGVGLGSPAPGGAELLSGEGVRQQVEGPGEALEILGIIDDQVRIPDPARGAVGAARHDGQPRGGRLEAHVGEGVVAGRQDQRVGGGVDVLEVVACAVEGMRQKRERKRNRG